MSTYDFIVIGGGRAGFAALRPVAAAGMRTALIDRGPIGGLCSLAGCNPKKVLVRSSEVLDEIGAAADFGIDVGSVAAHWSRVIDRKETFTGGVTESSERMLREMGTELIQGAPRFTGAGTIAVGDREIEASGFAIATGSVPRPLAFEGAEHVRTTQDILALRVVPKHLVCIGAGVVAFEFGHIFARLGAHVTIVTPDEAVLATEEAANVAALLEYSRELGIDTVFNAPVLGVRREAEHLAVTCRRDEGEATYRADFVLNSAGRVASLDGLALEAAGVAVDRRGVTVSDYLRSATNSRVFAAGDAHGRMQLSPIATYEGDIVAQNFLHGDTVKVAYDVIPRAIYTTPPLASVGLTEADARAKGTDVQVITSDMKEWTVFAIAGAPLARAKVILDGASGAVLGAHLVGPSSPELIHLFAMAMRFGITAKQLGAMQYAYPTFASTIPTMVG